MIFQVYDPTLNSFLPMEIIHEFHQEPTDFAGMETLNLQDPMFAALGPEPPFDFSTVLNSHLPDPTFWDTAFQSSDMVDPGATQDSVTSLGFGYTQSLDDIDSLTLYDWGVAEINPYSCFIGKRSCGYPFSHGLLPALTKRRQQWQFPKLKK